VSERNEITEKFHAKLVLHPLGVQGENHQQVLVGESPMKSFITVLLSSLAFVPASADWVRDQDKEKPNADTVFLTKVVPAIAASVKIIDYAANYASDEKVKDFAERVAKQHKESVKTASEHAKRLKIAVVTDPDKDSKEMIDKLSKLRGTDVDVAFLQWLSHIHEDTTVFESEVKNGDDADLKTYAKNSIAAGNEHLKESRALLAKVKK
jgi:putative membrane protein